MEGAEDAPELGVEQGLGDAPQLLPLLHPGGQHLPRLGVLVGLHALQQPRERLLPRQRVHVLLRVDDADLALQLGDDGARAPAVPQHEVRQVAVEVVPEVEYSGAAPLRQPQEVPLTSDCSYHMIIPPTSSVNVFTWQMSPQTMAGSMGAEGRE